MQTAGTLTHPTCSSPVMEHLCGSILDLVPVVLRVQRHAVDIHAELHRFCSPLCQCLSAMTRLTQPLPIAASPEQPEIPIVGSDVIHLCGQTFALGINAEPRTRWVLIQEATSCLFPPHGVAALPGGWSAVCCQLHGVFGVAMFAACFQDIEAARFNVGFLLAPDPPLRRIIVLLRRDHNGPLLGFVQGHLWCLMGRFTSAELRKFRDTSHCSACVHYSGCQLWLAIPFLNTLAEQKTNSRKGLFVFGAVGSAYYAFSSSS